ncbi:hypothetical protein evm_000807 [Chilo suppressalis]|nr:hypothetical protein evm_000807 [Chilo suppressalis]
MNTGDVTPTNEDRCLSGSSGSPQSLHTALSPASSRGTLVSQGGHVYRNARPYRKCTKPRVDRDRSPERCLREVASCRVCAPCYQASWRGTKTRADKKKLLCPICRRVAISVYNLLRHVRSHSDAEVRQHKRALSRALAQVLQLSNAKSAITQPPDCVVCNIKIF